MMKKWMILLVFAGMGLFAQAAVPTERIYISTDREAYIAGDAVWCSLFLTDEKGALSPFSAVAYLELVSTDGTAAEAKIGLLKGRGGGMFRIPLTTPTGQYRLLAYTALNADEKGDGWMAGSRALSVYNTQSTARVSGGVEILSGGEVAPLPARENVGESLTVSMTSRVRAGAIVPLILEGGTGGADVSVSVYHEDGLSQAENKGIEAFLAALPGTLPAERAGERMPEYDGEIVYATIEGGKEPEQGFLGILSSAGAPANIYIDHSTTDREIRFHTGNIYGKRELVCDVPYVEGDPFIRFRSPFVHPSMTGLPSLRLFPDQFAPLVARKASLRSEASVRTDTLSEQLSKREERFLSGLEPVHYHLDDYTRFPSVREILVEITPMLRLRRSRGVEELQMSLSDGTDAVRFFYSNVLVMMDGVVLTDLSLLLNFDAMLLEDIYIYRHGMIIGDIPFNGIVNFVTKKNYVTALDFPSHVKVVDFKGLSWPLVYTGDPGAGVGKDLRQLLYWHPCLRVSEGEQRRIQVRAPSYPGRFRVVAEGLSGDGKPLRQTFEFEVL